ncbi:hybrid sensor histidine kinase/response regulator transcription factor [Maribacter halichondriae]|uniref:hybrid sensor histidine kinase/response regulator transcription factor n=1 Tax=Maribacter halichondriae TaxID=2980554 RepID=UPI0023584BC1|nr:hybrid sensor histidine kinase/response regulator transcription factor [Maribacter sp. Hal144]
MRLFFGFTFLIYSCALAIAQERQQMAFAKLGDGLANEWISSITQDSLGFIWIGTQDGLHRYDGYKFEVIRNSPEELQSPAANWIRDIAIDKNGAYWLATYGGGISKFSAKDMTFLNFEEDSLRPTQGKQSYRVETVSENQVLSVSDKGFHLYDINSNESVGLSIGGLLSSMAFMDNSLWLSDTRHLFLYDLDNLSISHVKTFDSDIYFLQYIPELGTLVGFQDRLLLFKDQAIVEEIELEDAIIHFTSNGKSDYFMASRTSLFKFNPSLFQLTEVPIDFDTRTQKIESIFLDRQGTLWVGTDKGLLKEKKYNASFLSETIALHARSILKQSENLYIGGLGGLFSVNEGQITSIIEDKSIQSVIAVGDTIFAGTYGTEILSIWNNRPLDTLLLPISPDTIEGVFGITTDRKGRLWVGTWDGLYIYDKQKQVFDLVPLDEGINVGQIQIINIYLDKKDRLWVITSGDGIYKIENISNSHPESSSPQLINYRNISEDDTSLTSNIIITVEEDHQGQLWFGTDIGVAKYVEETDNFCRLRYQGSLFDKKVMVLNKDSDQNLWITTINDGIYVYREKEETLRHFTTNDGLISNAFLYGSGHFDEMGKNMLLGTDAGVQQIDLSKPFAKEDSTFPNITNFQVNSASANTSFTPSQIPFLDGVNLESSQNDFSVSFSAMDFIAPEKIGFSYTLDNDPWKKTDLQTAYFTKVAYGKHTLKVKSLYDGIPNNKNIASLEIYIAPPWYLSQIAKAIYILLFIASLWGIYRYLKWRWKMRFNLRLKVEEAERLKQLNDFRSKVYTDIAHEFKTPLTLIAGPIEKRLRDGTISDQAYIDLSTVQRNATRLTCLVDQLLQLATLENGKLRLQIIEGNLDLFLHLICQAFEYKAEQRQLRYSFHVGEIGKVWYDEDILEKIITNLLSNAFKYAPEHGICSFIAERVGNCVEIHLKNTVRDRSALQIEKLFTRFYQGDSSYEGMGVGLSLVKDLVRLYSGHIEAKLETNEIIHFCVSLPLGRGTFEDEDIVIKNDTLLDVPVLHKSSNLHPKDKPAPNENLPILLIVEDNTEIRTFVKQALQKEYCVLEAENGKEGLAISLSEVPDIILSDIRMPLYNGIQLCNRLKTDERTSHIPIILLTASTSEENELKGLASGADDFITKPFKMRILEQRISNLIATRRALRNRYGKEFLLRPKDVAVTPTDEVFLIKIQEILDEDLPDPSFNSEAFSRKAGMSRMQLHRKLLTYTGLSTSAFIRSQRLQLAKQLLQTSDITINEVAYSTGFNTPSYFMTCFKETYKKTPSEYLQSLQES